MFWFDMSSPPKHLFYGGLWSIALAAGKKESPGVAFCGCSFLDRSPRLCDWLD